MKDHSIYHAIFATLNPHITVLTPNRRLAAVLQQQYQQFQMANQQVTWPTADILPVASWFKRLWNDYTAQHCQLHPYLLTPLQEQFLWENILNQVVYREQLLQITETAQVAKSAWDLLKGWQVSINHPAFTLTQDYAMFKEWVLAFEKQCDAQQWLPNSELINVLLQRLPSLTDLLPQEIVLVGFTELSPQQKTFFSNYEKLGCAVSIFNIDDTSCCDLSRVQCVDEENEIVTMARWAKTLWEKDPSVRVACVIPNLDKIRDRVAQVFSQVFTQPATYTLELSDCPFNITAGKPLAHYPLINTALRLLALQAKKISLAELNYLLCSPFLIASESERFKRSQYYKILCQDNVTQIDLTQNDNINNYSPLLAGQLKQFFAKLSEMHAKQTFYTWANTFHELLTLLGWPGERSLNSEEYQIVTAWLNLLNEFAQYDVISSVVDYTYALSVLQKLAHHTIFQPQSPSAPIQILGILEAAAIPFDYVWLAGVDDISWPPQPRPNPLIPKSLQRELRMPHANAERELFFCNAILQQFEATAKHIMFSHVEKKDELELQVSPLIKDIPFVGSFDYLTPFISPSKLVFSSKQIEVLNDNIATPIKPAEKIYGGISVLKTQAACPFRAFASWRLHAKELEEPSLGLRHKDRGTIVHRILEYIWNTLSTQAALLAMPDDALRALISQAIDNVMQAQEINQNRQYIKLEQQRLHKLIWEWLEKEKTRTAFVVLYHEQTFDVTLHQLQLSLRIDRIDELEDGTKLLIDYKTSKNYDIADWFSERPDEPQLPLYALKASPTISAIAFAQIVPGNYCFKGISQHEHEIPGIQKITELKYTSVSSWVDQLASWNGVFNKLSVDFANGVATVDPKSQNKTCNWCKLTSLCRINEEIGIE